MTEELMTSSYSLLVYDVLFLKMCLYSLRNNIIYFLSCYLIKYK